MTIRSYWLLAGGVLSALAALLHLACIVGGPAWYRFFGAGERMVRLAQRGSPRAAVITACIAAVLALWAAYGFSGAGVIPRLPLLRVGLVVIAAIYLARGLAFPVMWVWRSDLSPAFLAWSSAIVLGMGVAYAVGTWAAWGRLGQVGPQ
jgi:hypothetical protein